MSLLEQAVVGLAVVLLAASVLATAFLALTGRDLRAFERLQHANPKQYRSVKRSARYNGPLVALACAAGLLLSPVVAFHPEGGLLLASAVLAASGLFLWLSVRWFFWSLRA